jgi:hypothetical protein
MPHRGWRIGRGSLETVPTDRLTADRLEGFLSFLGSVSPGSSTDSEVMDAPEQASEAERPAVADAPGRKHERPEPEATSPLVDSPPTVPLPAFVAATLVTTAVPAPADSAPPDVAPPDAAPTVLAPTIVAPTVVAPAVVASSVSAAAGVKAAGSPTLAREGGSPAVAHHGATPAVAPEGVGPTVARHVVKPTVVREVDAETGAEPSAIAPAAPIAAGSRTGRHRPPQSSRLSIRGISFSAGRFALLAAVTVLVVVSAVLALT